MDKKLCLIVMGLLGSLGMARAAVTIELDAGVLRTSTGTPLTSGLLQLVAYRSPTGTFAAPNSTSFVGGDTANELVVASVNFTQGGTGFVTGEADDVFKFTYENTGTPSSTTFDPGDELLLRWFPTLTTASTSPGLGTTYGQYRSSTAPDGGIAFFAPPDGSTLAIPNGLNFLTTTAGGSNLDTTGFASSVTLVGVPEPSTYGLVGGLLMCLMSVRAHKRRMAA